MSLTAIIVCFVGLLSVSSMTTDESAPPPRSLLFGNSLEDLVTFLFDYPSLSKQFTACLWIKPLDPGVQAIAWSYYGGDGTDTYVYPGLMNVVMGDYSLNHGRQFDGQTRGTWLHLCHTWQYDRNFKVFFNGQHFATSSASTGNTMGSGHMRLGNNAGGTHSSWIFGGEMSNFNMFRRELTNTEISRLYQGGVCYLDPLTDSDRELKWEDILTFNRIGNVTELDLTLNDLCEVEPNQPTYRQLEQTIAALKTTLTNTETTLNQTQTNLTSTETSLEETKIALEICLSTETSLNDQATHWDILYQDKYLNKVLTEEALNSLRSECEWNYIDDFVGLNITEKIVGHLKSYHGQDKTDTTSTWDVLDDFVGVTLSEKIVRHLKENHGIETAEDCNNTD